MENFISHIPGYNPRILGGSKDIIRQHNLPSEAFKTIPSYSYSAIKTHITPDERNIDVLRANGILKVLVMYRDPRDIIVSNYYHVLKDNPWMPDDPAYADYTEMSKEEALSHSMWLIVNDFCSWVEGWRRVPERYPGMQCLFVTYEELRTDPGQVFRNILTFFRIDMDDAVLEAVMRTSDTEPSSQPTGIEPGKRSTRRKGVIGGWREELSDQQKHYIKQQAGQYLVQLGYERNLEW